MQLHNIKIAAIHCGWGYNDLQFSMDKLKKLLSVFYKSPPRVELYNNNVTVLFLQESSTSVEYSVKGMITICT